MNLAIAFSDFTSANHQLCTHSGLDSGGEETIQDLSNAQRSISFALSGNATSKWDRIIQTKCHFLHRDFSPFLLDSALRLARRTGTSEHSLGVTWLPAVIKMWFRHAWVLPQRRPRWWLPRDSRRVHRRQCAASRDSTSARQLPILGTSLIKEGAPPGPVRVRGQSRRFP